MAPGPSSGGFPGNLMRRRARNDPLVDIIGHFPPGGCRSVRADYFSGEECDEIYAGEGAD